MGPLLPTRRALAWSHGFDKSRLSAHLGRVADRTVNVERPLTEQWLAAVALVDVGDDTRVSVGAYFRGVLSGGQGGLPVPSKLGAE
jgi:hypothetical protein